jgi:hypothetical protein
MNTSLNATAITNAHADYISGQWPGPTTGSINTLNLYKTPGISLTRDSAGTYSITGTSKSLAELQTQSTYLGLGWDFVNVWKINPGEFPSLMWE